MLAALTVVSGVGDAVSYLGLGHVFVANMTGNIVFLGFAAAGASQLSVPWSLTALAGFLLGSIGAGRLARRMGAGRRRWLLRGPAAQMIVVAARRRSRSRPDTLEMRAVRSPPCWL